MAGRRPGRRGRRDGAARHESGRRRVRGAAGGRRRRPRRRLRAVPRGTAPGPQRRNRAAPGRPPRGTALRDRGGHQGVHRGPADRTDRARCRERDRNRGEPPCSGAPRAHLTRHPRAPHHPHRRAPGAAGGLPPARPARPAHQPLRPLPRRARRRRVPAAPHPPPARDRWHCSNSGVAVLGHALAAATHTPWEDLVPARLLRPLGLGDTALAPTSDGRDAVGHGKDGRTPVPGFDAGGVQAAGALRSTPHDLLTFLEAHLRPGESPLADAFRATRRPVLRRGPGTGTCTRWPGSGTRSTARACTSTAAPPWAGRRLPRIPAGHRDGPGGRVHPAVPGEGPVRGHGVGAAGGAVAADRPGARARSRARPASPSPAASHRRCHRVGVTSGAHELCA